MNDIIERRDLSSVAAVVPSLHPDDNLQKTIRGLIDVGFRRIVLVDDGSGPDYEAVFDACARMEGVTLLRHEVNRGKGAALTNAIGYVLEHLPEAAGAVTVDGDGQHLPPDVARCAAEMLESGKAVLGVRDFSQPDVPAHNRRGNRITSAVMHFFCGMKVSDTQTGLRALPREVLKTVVNTKGDRYEFETQMLLDFKRFDIPVREVTIKTVYLEQNKSSHFRVFRDSARIYRLILAHFFKYSASSILSIALETLLIFLMLGQTKADLFDNALVFLVARACSSFFNMNMNYFFVFRSKSSYPKALLKYYSVALPVAAITLGVNMLLKYLVRTLDFLPENVENYSLVVINLIVQAILFFVTFKLQQLWVFRGKKKAKKENEGKD